MKNSFKQNATNFSASRKNPSFAIDKTGYDQTKVLKNRTTNYESGISRSQWPLPTNILKLKENPLLGFWGMESQLPSSLVSLYSVGGPTSSSATKIRGAQSIGNKALLVGMSNPLGASEEPEMVFRTETIRVEDYAPGGAPNISIGRLTLNPQYGDIILCVVMSKYTSTGSGLPTGFTQLQSMLGSDANSYTQVKVGYRYFDPVLDPLVYTSTTGGNEMGILMEMVAIGGTTTIDAYSSILVNTFDTDAAN